MEGLPSRLSWAASLIVILLLSLGLVGGDLGGCDFVGCRGQIRHTRGSGPSRRAGVTAARIGEADERAAPLHVERWCHGVDVSGGGRSFR